jgi:LysR family transcriptional regulator, hypochlorite-specific transcription factor HypT
MEIRLYRERPSAQRPGKPIVARLWDYLVQRKAEATKGPSRKRK